MVANKKTSDAGSTLKDGFVFLNARRPASTASGNDPHVVFIRREIAALDPPFNPLPGVPEFIPPALTLTGFALETNGQVLGSEPIHELVRQPETNFVPPRSWIEVPPAPDVVHLPSDAFYFYEEIITLMRDVLVWLDRNLTRAGKFAKKSCAKAHFLDTVLPDVRLMKKKLHEEDGDKLAKWYNNALPIGTHVPSAVIANHYDRCRALRGQAVGLVEIASVITEGVLIKSFPGQFRRYESSTHSSSEMLNMLAEMLNMALYFLEGNAAHKDLLNFKDDNLDPEFTNAEFFFLEAVINDTDEWAIEEDLFVPRLKKAVDNIAAKFWVEVETQ